MTFSNSVQERMPNMLMTQLHLRLRTAIEGTMTNNGMITYISMFERQSTVAYIEISAIVKRLI